MFFDFYLKGILIYSPWTTLSFSYIHSCILCQISSASTEKIHSTAHYTALRDTSLLAICTHVLLYEHLHILPKFTIKFCVSVRINSKYTYISLSPTKKARKIHECHKEKMRGDFQVNYKNYCTESE